MIRWGVVGPGSIASEFVQAMDGVADGEIVAVASRSSERASQFCSRFGIAKGYGDYDALAQDPDVDVVYIATPQSCHADDSIRFLQAGRAVLCEKPMALNREQAQRMADEATKCGLFFMEAIWSRFLPAYRSLMEVIASGRIGDPILVEADFGFRAELDPENRLFNLVLGGGALLDLGIYPIQLCSMLLGQPDRIAGVGIVGETRVDEQVAAVMSYPGGQIGVIKAAIRTNMSCTARISGTEGMIELPAFMHCPASITVSSLAGRETIDASYEGSGLRFEIEEVDRCLAAGLTESPTMPVSESLALASILDNIRGQIGVVYPGE